MLLLAVAAGIGVAAWPRPYAPEQPIAFSHKQHATDFSIPCQYCHSGARRAPFAGVPSVERCMGCHRLVAFNKPEIKKLNGYWDRQEPIPWTKVYVLPRYVHFNHEPHIRAAVRCQDCHGRVETMTRVEKVSSLEMGWCLGCHRARGAPVDCLTCHY